MLARRWPDSDYANDFLKYRDVIVTCEPRFNPGIGLRGVGRIGDNDPVAMPIDGNQMFDPSFPILGKGSGMSPDEGKDSDGGIAEQRNNHADRHALGLLIG